MSACFQLSRYVSLINNEYSPLSKTIVKETLKKNSKAEKGIS